MGNAIAKKSKRANSMTSAKVVMIDGSFTEFTEPITVAELMMEYPQHLVCHSSAVQSKRLQKKSALPADVQLEVGRLYYLLPASEFQGPLIAQTRTGPPQTLSSSCIVDAKKRKEVTTCTLGEILIRRMKLQEKNGARIKVSRELQNGLCNLQPVVRPLTSGLRITRDDTCVATQSKSKEEDEQLEEEQPIVSFSTPDLRIVYMNAAGARAQPCSNNSWKPRLETIQEAGALSRRRFQNFVRGRTSRSQVHDHLNYS